MDMADFLVPDSAKKLEGIEKDKEQNVLYRVVRMRARARPEVGSCHWIMFPYVHLLSQWHTLSWSAVWPS